MKVVMLGATKGMGRALARLLAERGESLFLLGRDADELERSAADLAARGGTVAGHAACDLETPAGFAVALDAADGALGRFDTVIVTAGIFATREAVDADPELARRIATVNHANTVTFCERARVRLLRRGGGTLCVFSSVAGERGRTPVVVYGSAKAGLSAYLEGLDHAYRADGLRVVCIKPGFVKTGMTAELEPPPFAGTPEGAARDALRAIDRGAPVAYTPRI